MPDELVVDVNRGSPHEIDVETDRFEPSGAFDVRLRNHGKATHVHLALDGELARATTLPETNHFVDTDAELTVPVGVVSDLRPAAGRLKIATGYGAETAYVGVTIRGDDSTTEPTDDGASVARERSAQSATAGEGRQNAVSSQTVETLSLDHEVLLIVGLALVAVVLAVGALVATDSTIVVVGALLVIAIAIGGVVTLSLGGITSLYKR